MGPIKTKSPKADNILSGLGWVMIDGIKAASRILLNNGRTNLSEDAESLREGIYNTKQIAHQQSTGEILVL